MNSLSHKTTHTQFLVGKLSLPDVLCDLVKDYLFIDHKTSYYLNYMRRNVLNLIKRLICSEMENPESYVTTDIISYRFYKKYRPNKHISIMESTICVSCGDYRVYNGCLNSMCTCTDTYGEWSDYDEETEMEQNDYDENKAWHEFMMDEEWVQGVSREEMIQEYGEDDLYLQYGFLS